MTHGQDFQFTTVQIHMGEENSLGTGSYGAVYKATCDELPCAAKRLHPILFQTSDPNSVRLLQRFEQECEFMKNIKHPNIVQYLGVTRDPESNLPVLIMELLDESLTTFLERSQEPLSYHIQVDLNHDIAIAIAHLHCRGIIHRDLSSNNVLLIAGRRAKVTDFGMSKLVDAGGISMRNSLTHCPGTEVYMPPEALLEPPLYTKKIDCFSFGVLIVQTIIRLFPNPGPRSTLVSDPRSPTGMISMPVLESERRASHISLIDPTHPLLPIAERCINYNQVERPTAQQLCHQLTALKTLNNYIQSKQCTQHDGSDQSNNDRLIQDLRQQLQVKDDQMQAKDDQIQASVRENEQMRRLVEDSIRETQETRSRLEGATHLVDDRDRQLRGLNYQLQDNEQMIVNFRQTIAKREREIEEQGTQICELQHQIRQMEEELQKSRAQEVALKQHINLTWRKAKKAPFKPASLIAVAVDQDGRAAYFRDTTIHEIYRYNSMTDEWAKLINPPVTEFPLVVIEGLLTAVGGWDSQTKGVTDGESNTLLSLVGKVRWVERFPAMPTKRYNASAVSNGKVLIVAGGRVGSHKLVILNTVEVLNIASQQWYTACKLLTPLYLSSAIICGEHLYLVGGYNQDNKSTKMAISCSLSDLLLSLKSAVNAELNIVVSSQVTVTVWHKIADLPMYKSATVSINNQLIAIGGCAEDYERTNSIYKYNPSSDFWEIISHMPTARSLSLVAFLQPENKLIVVGGFGIGKRNKIDSVEIAEIF